MNMMDIEHWNPIRLDEFCELVLDCVNKTAPVVEYETAFKMIRTTNVKDGYVSLDDVRHVTSDVYEKWTRRSRPESGDVIMTREAPLGEVGLLRNAHGVFLGQRLVMYRSNPNKNDNKFLLYALMGHDLQSQIKAYGSGSTVEHMRVPDCSALVIKRPPLPTQKKIASILSAYDDLIENNNRRIKILEEMAQNIYREWFVHFRYPGHEDVPMVDSELGQIPQGWEVKKLGDVLAVLETGSRPKGGVGEITAGIPSIGAESIKGVGKFDFSQVRYIPIEYFAKMKQGIIQDRDVLVYKDGGTPRYFIPHISMFGEGFPFTTMAINSHVYRLRAINQISQEYLYLYLSSPSVLHWMHLYGTGAAIPSIARRDLVRLPIIVPSREAHQQFLTQASASITQILFLSKKNQNLRKTRDLLLPKLISGQLDVEELDIAV